MDDDAPRPAPPGWLEALDRGEADVAAGRTVPGEAVMERLRQTTEGMRDHAAPASGCAGPEAVPACGPSSRKWIVSSTRMAPAANTPMAPNVTP